jgi:hypothetical protein
MKRQGVALCVLSAAAARAWDQDCQGWQSPDRALLDGATASLSWDPARSEALLFRARVQGDRSDFLVCRDGRVEALASFPGEPALASQHACFDAARGVMVLLGRASPATYLWDGQAWSVRPAPAELTRWVGRWSSTRFAG